MMESLDQVKKYYDGAMDYWLNSSKGTVNLVNGVRDVWYQLQISILHMALAIFLVQKNNKLLIG